MVRYKFQGDFAKHYGADEVIYTKGLEKSKLYKKIVEMTGGEVLKPVLGKPVVVGGADIVFECVGSDDSIDDALRLTKQGGKTVFVGLVGITKKWIGPLSGLKN